MRAHFRGGAKVMQADAAMNSDAGSQAGSEDEVPEWAKLSESAMRVHELDQIEQAIARLLHLAGCTIASLHPDPLSSFTDREIELDDDGEQDDKDRPDYDKYAREYFTTLNDIQLALRTSIRDLRLSRALPTLLLDPAFSVPGGAGATIGVGGKHIDLTGTKDELDSDLSLAALEAQKEAWQDIVNALAAIRQGENAIIDTT